MSMIPEAQQKQPDTQPVLAAEAPPYQPPAEGVPTISFTSDQIRTLAHNLLEQKDELQKVLTAQRLDNFSLRDNPEQARAAGKEKTSGLDIGRIRELISLLDKYKDDPDNEELVERIAIASTSVLEPDTLTRESGASLDAVPPAPQAEPAPLGEPDQEGVAMKGMPESESEGHTDSEVAEVSLTDAEQLHLAERLLQNKDYLQRLLTKYRLDALSVSVDVKEAMTSDIQNLETLISLLKRYQSQPSSSQLVSSIYQQATLVLTPESLLKEAKADYKTTPPGRKRREAPYLIYSSGKPDWQSRPSVPPLPDEIPLEAEQRDFIAEDVQHLFQEEAGEIAPSTSGEAREVGLSISNEPTPPLPEQLPQETGHEQDAETLHEVMDTIDRIVTDPSKAWIVDFTADQVTRGFESGTRDLRTKYRAYDFIPAIKTMLDNFATLPQSKRFSHAEMNELNQYFHRKVAEKRATEKSE